LHLGDDGQPRDLSKAESDKLSGLLTLRTRGEATLVAREQFELHGPSEMVFNGHREAPSNDVPR
jgi:hypothetical protein